MAVMAQVRAYVESVLAQMGWGGWILVAIGLVMLVFGMFTLRSARRAQERLIGIEPEASARPAPETPLFPSAGGGVSADRAGGEGGEGGAGGAGGGLGERFSPATLYVMGLGLLVLGYHAVAWGLPGFVVPMRWPEQQWWALVVLVLGLGGVSVMIDRFERRQR
jgi:hypothetical protein